jgi:hypothetical protein
MLAIRRRLALLTVLGAVGGALFVPFILAGPAQAPPVAVLLVAFTLGSGSTTAVASYFGLKWADRATLPMPVLRHWETGISRRIDWKTLRFPIAAGTVFGLLAAGIGSLVGVPENPGSVLVRLATAPFAAVVPEVLVHLFLMSGLVILLRRAWPAILLSAIAFVLLFHGNPPGDGLLLATFVMGFNFTFGLLTGWLYWRWGFLGAVLAHAAAHLVVLGVN